MGIPIFVIGCARSGTTIVGQFFEHNSKCVFFDEVDIWKERDIIADQKSSEKISISLWKILRKIIPSNLAVRKTHYYVTKNISRKKNPKQSDRLVEEDLTEKEVQQTKHVLKEKVGDKNLVIKSTRASIQIPFIKKLFPNAKFIHVIRDGRDVTCSLMKGNEGEYWPHLKPPGWKDYLNSETVIRCAWIWNSVIDIIRKDISKIPKNDYVELKYEEFIDDPQKIMKNIFEFLDFPFEKPQVELCSKVSNKMDKKFLTGTNSDDWASFDHKNRVQRYKENLDESQLKKVEAILGKNNEKFGYS